MADDKIVKLIEQQTQMMNYLTKLIQNHQAWYKRFTQFFVKVKTEVCQRYKCLHLSKWDNEDFREYASRVNLHQFLSWVSSRVRTTTYVYVYLNCWMTQGWQ